MAAESVCVQLPLSSSRSVLGCSTRLMPSREPLTFQQTTRSTRSASPHHQLIVTTVGPISPRHPLLTLCVLLLLLLQVTVALIDLSPEFSFVSVPRLSPYSYLRAKARNSSPYTILRGPANIFLDNNFIAKVCRGLRIEPESQRTLLVTSVCMTVCA